MEIHMYINICIHLYIFLYIKRIYLYIYLILYIFNIFNDLYIYISIYKISPLKPKQASWVAPWGTAPLDGQIKNLLDLGTLNFL